MFARAELQKFWDPPKRSLIGRLRYWWQMRGIPRDGHWREWEDEEFQAWLLAVKPGKVVKRTIVDEAETHRHSIKYAMARDGYFAPPA